MARINRQAPSEANAEVTEADLRAALNRIVRDSLAPVSTGLGLHYIAFAVKHALTLSQPAASIMCLASGSAAAILLGFRLALRRWSVPERWVYPVVTMMAALLLFTNFLHLNLVSEPHQTANLIAVIMGAGFIALSARWLALMLMVIWIGWGATVWMSPPSSAWLYYAFALFAATVVAMIIHTVRVRALLRFETLRVQHQARTQALEAALAAKEISQLQLRESETRYRTLVENSPDAIYVHSSGKILYANPASARLVGAAEAQQLIGKSVIDFVAAEYRSLAAERMRRIMQEGITLPFVELKGIRLDGTSVEVETMGLPIIYQGRPAVQVIVRDITGSKQMEEQLRRYTTDLEKIIEERTQRIRELEKQRIESEKLAATGRMAARIAHEINNPLDGIQAAFRLVSRAVPAEHRHHHYVGKIEKEIERISRIMRQMLELHKPQVEAPKAFRPDVTIAEVIALLKPQFLERHIQFNLDLERARENITLPENMLRQILYNVLLNALEASRPEGHVLVSAQTRETSLEITVADHGEGISEENKARIFEPFFTTKSNSSTGGLGLGLSICKNLVEAMNGTITFDSKPGEGTICRIVVPLNKNEKNDIGEGF
jgi:PAS domain S-box-containing protein